MKTARAKDRIFLLVIELAAFQVWTCALVTEVVVVLSASHSLVPSFSALLSKRPVFQLTQLSTPLSHISPPTTAPFQ